MVADRRIHFLHFLCPFGLCHTSFFRDPPRAISQTPIAFFQELTEESAKVQKVENPYTGKEEILISTFMNVFNIHSNRSLIRGGVLLRLFITNPANS